MKKITLLLVLCISVFGYAQEEMKLLKKINGVEIYYQFKKTQEHRNKDRWVIFIEYKNATDTDLYYTSYSENKANAGLSFLTGKDESETLRYGNFANIHIENVSGFLRVGEFTGLRGDRMRLITDKGDLIFVLKKNKTYTRKLNFKETKGIKPILRTEIINSITFTERFEDYF